MDVKMVASRALDLAVHDSICICHKHGTHDSSVLCEVRLCYERMG
jgi:hypothetical protein